MKKNILLILFTFSLLFFSCEEKSEPKLTIISNSTQIDTLLISEQVTDKVLAKIHLEDENLSKEFHVDETSIAEIHTKDSHGSSYLTIISPNKELNITIHEDSTFTTQSLGDSLLNSLSDSRSEFFNTNSDFIFTTDDGDSLIRMFENFRLKRKKGLEEIANVQKLDPLERELLLFKSDAGIYSFLFFFGKTVKKFPPENEYYSFIDSIDHNSHWLKTLPHIALWKHEINYLREFDSLTNLKLYANYMDSLTENQDLFEYLKATYFKESIERPYYWEKHQDMLTQEALKEQIEELKMSKYFALVEKPYQSFASSQKGAVAFDFTAERLDGSTVNLSDMKGKVVFIDTWASWCGPCIAQRPKVLALEKKYHDDPRVTILTISVDANRNNWVKYLTKKDELEMPSDLFIKNGREDEFGKKYNIHGIPKYILIDPNGLIINSNLEEPSLAVEKLIEKELKNM